MCESKVYLLRGEDYEKIFDEAMVVKQEKNNVEILGFDKKLVVENAVIVKVDATKHEIYIKKI